MTVAFRAALAVVAVLTLVRLLALAFGHLDLGGDEAQYWAWAQAPAFGYFSKPPLVAWIIAASTSVLGDTAFAVRAAAPLLHGLTALTVFAIAVRLYDQRTALWSAITYATLPAVSLSSGLMTTDVPLLLCWALALLGLVHARERPTPVLAVLTGLAIGLGLLAKYAMVYFLVCAGLAALVLPALRPLLISPFGALAGLVALLVFAPNIAWNAHHGFPTFAHTASNANLGGTLFNPDALGEFVLAQFGVFGPLLFAALLVGIGRIARSEREAPEAAASNRLLLAFSLPVLVIACVIAFVSRANANWAAPAYIAATPLVVHWFLAGGHRRLFGASLQLHMLVALALAAVMVWPAVADAVGLSNGLKRVRGWEALGTTVAQRADDRPYTAILADDRELMGELLFYANPRTIPVVMWDFERAPRNHYELMNRITPATGQRVLFVSWVAEPRHVTARFAASSPLEPMTVSIDPKRNRTVYLFDLAGFSPAAAPPDEVR